MDVTNVQQHIGSEANLINTLSSLLLFFQVIDYYVKKEMVEITPISLPGHQPNIKVLQHMYLKSKINNKRQNELIPYNDCLYRNLYQYKYIALLDIDEVIMPLGSTR